MIEETLLPEESNEESIDESTWAKDQEKRSYYYDDSYGYQTYDPDEDEDEDEDES